MTRKEREWKTVVAMIDLFCRGNHSHDDVCPECEVLKRYVRQRMENCPQGVSKRSCRRCVTHCYSPFYRSRIREVMRYSGPRMLWHHPVWTMKHLLNEL